MTQRRPICEDDLHAWADGRLSAARRAEIEAWLAEEPARAARVAGWRRQGEQLHKAYDAVLDEPVPARLRAVVEARRPQWPRRAAAALVWLALGGLVGGGAGYRLGQATQAPAAAFMAELPERAAVAHAVYSPEVRHPVEVGADQERHLVAWLSKRLGGEVRAPYLGEQGFALLGGRLLPAQDGPGAQFMYEDKSGRRLTLYLSAKDKTTTPAAFRFAEEGDIGVFYWVDGGFAYALSGKLTRAELLPLADAAYRQLTAR